MSKESIKEKKAIVLDICDILDDEFQELQEEASPYIPCIFEYRRRINDKIYSRYFNSK